ncbi:hypothetical protein OM076_08685 [Solirubrobacter ginsenosidimutans]|uniref:Uncharacterized protein n=1 Tax=Solirubrobacter ginsenosidimutans TaxID=490573 RepID=A0A9X3MSD3_9ACTN|nr:hypothetical protein [Solirubrobacter ginsenosidimutans]MDA0160338.1 hypothetical protein [Solirubrobacter ginsenosidimutans]
MTQPRERRSTADRDRLIGILVAFAVVLVVAGALMLIFGVPARQDCVYEHFGKGAFTASCVRHGG